MESKAELAGQIAARMAQVARSDSRFGRDFSQFIPSFDGAEAAGRAVVALSECRGVKSVFITPDNAVAEVRRLLLRQGVDLIVPSYGLHRGFVRVPARSVPASAAPYAGWLDAIEHFGQTLSLDDLAAFGSVDLIVTGASAITMRGLRFGMGDFYLDIEWAILRAIGVFTPGIPVVAVVHDMELADADLAADPSNIAADVIVTPTRVLRTPPLTRPSALDWSIVPEALARTPTLQAFRRLSTRSAAQ